MEPATPIVRPSQASFDPRRRHPRTCRRFEREIDPLDNAAHRLHRDIDRVVEPRFDAERRVAQGLPDGWTGRRIGHTSTSLGTRCCLPRVQ